MQHSHPTLPFKPLISFPPTLYLLPLHPHHRLMLLAVFLYLLLSLPFPDSLGVLQWNAGGLEATSTELLHFILLTLFASRNLTLICLPLSGSLDSLLCEPMAPTPGLVFYLLMSQTPAAASSFSSGRVYLSLSFLPPLFLRLTPYSDYVFFLYCIVHIYPPFTRKRIVSLYFGLDVRTRLGVAISEVSDHLSST